MTAVGGNSKTNKNNKNNNATLLPLLFEERAERIEVKAERGREAEIEIEAETTLTEEREGETDRGLGHPEVRRRKRGVVTIGEIDIETGTETGTETAGEEEMAIGDTKTNISTREGEGIAEPARGIHTAIRRKAGHSVHSSASLLLQGYFHVCFHGKVSYFRIFF